VATPLAIVSRKSTVANIPDHRNTTGKLGGAEGKTGAYLALSRKCPHLGCTVPYNPSFVFNDPDNGGQSITGWFRCPCHGSTYSDTGRRVFGPAPRSMDVYAMTISPDGVMTVNLDVKFPGTPENAKYAVFPGEELDTG
jgi:cytochrome b6-f complex iron-sulfur subunit